MFELFQIRNGWWKKDKKPPCQVHTMGSWGQTSTHGNQEAAGKRQKEAGESQVVPEGIQRENDKGKKEIVQQNTEAKKKQETREKKNLPQGKGKNHKVKNGKGK